MGFFSAIKKIFSTGTTEGQEQEKLEPTGEQVPGEVAAPEQSAAPSEATQPAPEQTGPEPGLEQAGSREYASEAPPMPHEEPAREVSVQAGSAPEHSGQESAAVEQPLSAGESAADMAHSTEADRVAGASSVSSPHGTEPSAVAAVAASGDQALTHCAGRRGRNRRFFVAAPFFSAWRAGSPAP